MVEAKRNHQGTRSESKAEPSCVSLGPRAAHGWLSLIDSGDTFFFFKDSISCLGLASNSLHSLG